VQIRNVVVVVLACLVAGGAWIIPGAAPAAKTPKVKPPPAGKLLKLDDAERWKFEIAHPGALPEKPLLSRLPLPSAAQFNWCDLNQDFHVHSQGKSSSCWANAAIEALECNWLIRNGVRHKLSPQPILDYTQIATGANAGVAFDVLLKHGTAGYETYKFTGHPGQLRKDIPTRYRAIAWGRVGRGPGKIRVEEVKLALLKHGPLVVSMEYSTPAFHKYKTGVFAEHYKPGKGQPKVRGHAVLLLGWDDRRGHNGAWYIKNSWGEKWGERGYCWIEYGCNNICYRAYWVKAQSTYYTLPEGEFLKLVPDSDPPMVWNSPVSATAVVKAVRMEQNVIRNGKKGVLFHVTADIGRAKGKSAYITLFLEDKDGKNLPATAKHYTTTEGHLRVRTQIIPSGDYATYEDVALFLPYALLPGSAGKSTYRFRANVWCDKWLCSKNPYRGSFWVSR
jgi:hypothetical protein